MAGAAGQADFVHLTAAGQVCDVRSAVSSRSLSAERA